jgi:adenine-specific DNA-methyltransferase
VRVHDRFSPRNKATLFAGDCRTLLADLPKQSVDLIVTSPPYCIGKEYDKSVNTAYFVELHEAVIPELLRVLMPGGSICWQTGYHVKDGVLTPLDWLVHGVFQKHPQCVLRNRIIWTFGHGPHCRNRFSGRHETLLWYTNGDDHHFDLDAVRVPQKYPGKRFYKGEKKGEFSGNPLGKNPGDVWDIPSVKSSHIEKTEHPCQFPVALAQKVIRALCPKGGTVLDPFAGAGTVGVAAMLESRRFIGAELVRKYADAARDRIEQASNGKIRYRPLHQPIAEPIPTQAVAMKPPHFI